MYLNTSHVKVKLSNNNIAWAKKENLNTSHVKVKLAITKGILSFYENLNTSHVKVKPFCATCTVTNIFI